MYSIPARGRMMKTILMVSVLVSCLMSVSGDQTFSWSDCGVPLNKAIHYQSAAISPDIPKTGGPLAINVQATIADIVYDADTRLMVWKDGVLFMDVYIDKLCAIISNTKALSCPLYVGQTSFTYKFDNVPTLPSGDYVINIKSYAGSSGTTETLEIGCIAFEGTVSGAGNNVKEDKCLYKSSFSANLKGDAHYTTDVRTDRKVGDLIQIGPLGRLPSSDKPFEYGTFVGDFLGSEDLGGDINLKSYYWTLNGTLASRVNDSLPRILDTYIGTFYVFYNNGTTTWVNMRGLFNLTFDYDPNRLEEVSGSIWLDPKYYVLDQFNWPIVIGNLGPFSLSTEASGNFRVAGSHNFCLCGVDECGVCNGNGRTCPLGAIHHNDDDDWGVRKKAAVACGAVALLLLILVIDLSRRILREKRRIPIDDTDLLDHPEKPDYGTMAIDDAIREGERVV